MTETNEQQHARPERRLPRWLWRAMIVAAVLGALWGADQLLHPRLHPVTRRLLPDGHGVIATRGYPAVEATLEPTGLSFTWLDASCRPVGRPFRCRPAVLWRSIASNQDQLWFVYPVNTTLNVLKRRPEDFRLVLYWRDGRSCQASASPCPIDMPYLPLTTADGHLTATGRSILRLDGESLALSDDGRGYVLCDTACSDPRYLVLRSYQSSALPADMQRSAMPARDISNNLDRMYLYDTVQRRLTVSFPQTTDVNMAALDGERVMAVSGYLGVTVFEQGGKVQIARMTAQGYWFCSEDGSVWTVRKRKLAILHWRRGTPRLVATNIESQTVPPSYPTVSSTAVHGDGRLIACTETVQLLPKALWPTIQRAGVLLQARKHLPREVRRLTLYRNNRRIGAFDVRISSDVSDQGARFYEHLAFTRDGKSLSWVIYDGNGGQQVYAFRVPGQ